MAEFKESQKKYSAARNGYKAATKEFYLVRQQSQLLDKKIKDVLDAGLLASLPATHALSKQKTELQKKFAVSEAAVIKSKAVLDAARAEFNTLGTAITTINNFNDSIPILLLPLRLQTRFIKTKHIARNCPDDLVVNFGKLDNLAKQSISSIKPVPRPPGNTFTSVSSPAYILSNIQSRLAKSVILNLNNNPARQRRWRKVEDSYELWVRIYPDDIFLQSHEPALTESEIVAAKVFWQKMWDAERDLRLVTSNAETLKLRNEKQLEAWKELRTSLLAHRANWIARIMKPADYPDNFPLTVQKIPDNKFPDPGIKAESWTMPPFTQMLPENFIVKVFFKNSSIPTREVVGNPIPDYVQMGFDPEEKNETSFSAKGKIMDLPAAIRWITDIEDAEKAGMAVRIALSQTEYLSGVTKLVVTGLKTGLNETEGMTELTNLFDNHHYKQDGMAFLPQGTATNNLPGHASGFSHKTVPAEDSFKTEFSIASDPDSDGRRLATALGLEPNAFAAIFNSARQEGKEALLINRALWSGTMGYYLDNHMRPAITDADISFIKTFFQNFVTGRGLLPSFRIGKQPYGIVPVTDWNAWKPGPSASESEMKLIKFLKKIDGQWEKLAARVKTMKKIFDNNTITDEDEKKKGFRELLAMQASSTKYFRRLVAGEYLLWNVNSLAKPPNTEKVGIKTTPPVYMARLTAADAWNAPVSASLQILGKFFEDENYKLTDLPTNAAISNDSGGNFFSVLVNATIENLKANTYGDTFNKFVSHNSSRLLFYLARFALLQGWVDAAITLLRNEKAVISPLARLDFELEYLLDNKEPSNEHKLLLTASGINGAFETRKNKWSFLDEVLGDGAKISDRITQRLTQLLNGDDPVKKLQDTQRAMSELSALPLGQLERLFSEHIDLCSFRLDAWLQGLALSRLFDNREKQGFEKGIFLGAYGYLENLSLDAIPWVQVKEVPRPEAVFVSEAGNDDVVMPVYDFTGFTAEQIAVIKKFVFVYMGSEPDTLLKEDPVTKTVIHGNVPVSEGGFVLTPSLEHASTAGILRAGYEHHTISEGSESKTLAVNLSSERSGWAMDMLKSMKAGHSLNEQIGYFIERKMYDNPILAGAIPNLRKAFPLHIERNEWDDDDGQEIKEQDKITNLALVTDGVAIIDKYQSPNTTPTWDSKVGAIFSLQAAKNEFVKIVEQALDRFDAVSDLVLAESVYQTVKGSPEKVGAALRMTGEGAHITLPEVVNIPIEYRLLTHRVGLVLNEITNLENAWATGTAPVSAFVKFSPRLNHWLADQLPLPRRIFASVLLSNNTRLKIGILSTGIQPIDLFYMIRKSGDRPEESSLTWLFEEAARKTPNIDPKSIVSVSFGRDEKFTATDVSIKELIPLIKSIGGLIGQSRPLKPADLLLTSETASTPIADTYDNSSLKTVCGQFSDDGPTGLFNSYLKKLAASKKTLQENLPVGFGSAQSDAAYYGLYQTINEAYLLGVWDAKPLCPLYSDKVNADILLDQTEQLEERITKRLAQINAAFGTIGEQTSATGDKIFDMLSKLGKQVCGEDFLILPLFRLQDPAGIKSSLADTTLAASVGEFGLEEWLQSLSMVRDSIRKYQVVANLRSVFESPAANRSFKILQLPYVPGGPNSWVGVKFPADYSPPPQVTSMVYEFSIPFNVTQTISGIMVDDWREKVPLPELTTGISIEYNQSNSEAPQCMLLVVPPEIKGAWDWQGVVNAVMETMELAKKRAVDSELIQATWLSQFLPAIVTPVDAKNNTPNMDFKWAGPKPKINLGADIGVTPGTGGGVFTT